MTETLTILACQISVPTMTTAEERDAHLVHVADKIRDQLDREPAQLVVLPELSAIDYGRDAFESLDVLAEDLDGPSFEVFRDVAKTYDTTIVYGIARRDGVKNYISQVVVGPEGKRLGSFDKLHRAEFGLSEEKEFFSPGNHLLTFQCCGWRIAPVICYDIRFPELCRTLVLEHDTDLILHCGAYGRDDSFDTWHQFVTTRAMENQVPILSLNRSGALFGNSVFCGPWIDGSTPLRSFPEHDEAFVRIDVARQDTLDVREKYTFLQDRLPSYSGLKHVSVEQGDHDA